MSIFTATLSGLSGVADVISKKKKKRRKRRKAKQKKQQQRDAMRNKLNAGFNTTPQSTNDALDSPSGSPEQRTDNDAQVSLSNPLMLAIVGLVAYKFFLKK